MYENYESEHFLSFVRDSGALIEQAATETGFDVFVSDTNNNGETSILPGRVAVWTREIARDHGPFWDQFPIESSSTSKIRVALEGIFGGEPASP